jgi:transcriptional regulator with XRE-family HTH domain
MKLSEFLKESRNKLDLTLDSLSRASGLSTAFLSRIENQEFDKNNFSLNTVIKLAKGLGVKVSDILDSLKVTENSSSPSLPIYLRQKFNINNSKDHNVIEDIIKRLSPK